MAVLVTAGCGEIDASFDAAQSSDGWISEARFTETGAGRQAVAHLRATFDDYPVKDMYYLPNVNRSGLDGLCRFFTSLFVGRVAFVRSLEPVGCEGAVLSDTAPPVNRRGCVLV